MSMSDIADIKADVDLHLWYSCTMVQQVLVQRVLEQDQNTRKTIQDKN
jgi:hypothetical protein